MKILTWTFLLSLGISAMLYANVFEEKILDCNAGHAKACLDAGKTYSAQAYKAKGYDKNKAASKVASLYKKSCNFGHAEGCTAYAMQYTADKEKDPHKNAQYYFQKGCDGGDDTACTMLKMMPDTK